MATARKDMAETAASRSNVYGLLAAVFRAEPSAAFLAQVKSSEFANVLESLDLSLGDDFQDTPCDQLVEGLAVEYTRLFIGPGPRISPHESTNIEFENPMEGTLWGPQTVKVKKFIEAAGLAYDELFDGMPDHVSAELEFMQRLATKEAEAWEERNEEFATNILKIEERFLDEHLSLWISRFCDKVIEHSEHPFYQGFAEVTKGFLEYEGKSLQAFNSGTGNGRGFPD
ncbi:MAG: molecular chaperone TorD family protein [Rhodospirillales bacterium]|nr:molecular chaperone TorD family protein [Rhodospirillales bacterium]MDH3967121.1 molecular chaperone TorD family protein [Rhodospirillales bacterium]